MKGIQKYRNNCLTTKYPKQLKLVVQGGAGCGKSHLINTGIQTTERTIRKQADNPDHPCIIPTAPTGTAANLINGRTLHGAFNFSFSTEYISYSSELKDLRREQLKNLVLIVVDEMSMMKADQLYQLDLRLQEVKQRPDEDFGGVSVVLLGDMLQLAPVRGRYLFEEPSQLSYQQTDAFVPLWRSFKVINLIQNHRQGADREWADILNRTRIGENTKEDIEILESRIRPSNHPDIPNNAMYVAGTREAVHKINTSRIQELDTEEATSDAINYSSAKKILNPEINDDGTIENTFFMNKLYVKIGARVMLIHNIDVADHLTNGTIGEILSFMRKENGQLKTINVEFRDEKSGDMARQRNPEIQQLHPENRPTPIGRIEHQYSKSKKGSKSINPSSKAKIYQFPLILAFAATGHKFQGHTIYKPMKLVADMSTVFAPSQAYVMLSRVQEINQLFIIGKVNPKQLKPCEKALAEVKRLEEVSINKNLPPWYNNELEIVRIIFLNTRSHKKHYADVKHSELIKMSDLILLSEGWLNETDEECYDLPNYCKPKYVVAGRGKGLVTYHNNHFKHVKDINKENYQMTLFESDIVNVISVYRSKDAPLKDTLLDVIKLWNLVDKHKPCIVGGDFNISADQRNPLTSGLEALCFKQQIRQATHEKGNILDHLYYRPRTMVYANSNKFVQPEIALQSVYWSDHDAITVMIPTSKNSNAIVPKD